MACDLIDERDLGVIVDGGRQRDGPVRAHLGQDGGGGNAGEQRGQREGGQDEAGSCVCRGRRRPSAAQERRADAHKSGDQQDGAWR